VSDSTRSMHEEAVEHARLAERAADLAWGHLDAEYTQEIPKVLATLATEEPLAWTLPHLIDDNGGITYLAGETFEEIDEQYHDLRQMVEIHGSDAIVEIRQSWYTLTHAIVTLKNLALDDFTRGQTVTMFPIGRDGILGEVQVGAIGARKAITDEQRNAAADEANFPQLRWDAWRNHNRYIDALRAEDVEGIVAAHFPNGASAIRNYLTPTSRVLNADSAEDLGRYYAALFEKYHVLDIQLVNRVAESWYVFADLHWTVQEREGERRTLEFCTAETSTIHVDGGYWARTGAGTDPVVV
jgi:hypothetical protein